jgi:hypothetical protein
MRIQFASDLHLDEWIKTTFDETLDPVAPVLALCGDIATLDNPNLPPFLEWCSERWKTILWIPGKTEQGWDPDSRRRMAILAQPYKNITIFHHKAMMSEDGFVVIGLLYGMYPQDENRQWNDEAKRWEMPDPSPLPIKGMREIWQAERKWLADFIRYRTEPVIVLSHFPPAPWLSQERFVARPGDVVRSPGEEKMMESTIVAWICGNTHKTVEFTKYWFDAEGAEHRLLLVTNPRGRPLENMEYRREAVLALTNPLGGGSVPTNPHGGASPLSQKIPELTFQSLQKGGRQSASYS